METKTKRVVIKNLTPRKMIKVPVRIIKEGNNKMLRMVITVWGLIILAIFASAFAPAKTHAAWAKDYERQQRLEACTMVYVNHREWVDQTNIHKSQSPVIRCATMMGLIGAYESGFYSSRKCMEDNNCFGIKQYSSGRFKTYKDRFAGKLHFAELYLVWRGNSTFRGHKNRTISQFVEVWSGDDRATELRYIKFVKAKYWKMYRELENFEFEIRY